MNKLPLLQVAINDAKYRFFTPLDLVKISSRTEIIRAIFLNIIVI